MFFNSRYIRYLEEIAAVVSDNLGFTDDAFSQLEKRTIKSGVPTISGFTAQNSVVQSDTAKNLETLAPHDLDVTNGEAHFVSTDPQEQEEQEDQESKSQGQEDCDEADQLKGPQRPQSSPL